MSLSFICACFSAKPSRKLTSRKGCYVSEGRVVQNVHFDLKSRRLSIGAFTIVEMLFSSSLLAIVGAGDQPSLSPRRLCLFNTVTRMALRELNFLTSCLAILMNRKRLLVILQDKTYIYDIKSLTILDTIDTVPNLKGLCAFSPSLDGCFLALLASTTKGSLLLYNVMELHPQCEIDAPCSPLAAIALSSSGVYIATASEQGTIESESIWFLKQLSFRRGTYPSTIYSLSFGPSMELPDILVATSSSGSIHGFSMSQRLMLTSYKFLHPKHIKPSALDAEDPFETAKLVLAHVDRMASLPKTSLVYFLLVVYMVEVASTSSKTKLSRVKIICSYFSMYSCVLRNLGEPGYLLTTNSRQC
ncbi:hypothetical protein UlMin_000279 [Ulmus minor]